ncbi:hypothetical protein ACFQY7_17380 [Actinomadura luteofluorescens]|uniref:Uncharacterized protein n=1 Tax=Actinomadura luteofluorescens TaxID=46163 RepID=A0A7Y9JJU2_9ACTN|nr:hypothetical protein [Actinomadura luteofluorescens]NYD51832.1 hypothetical protein [Actinomadura luteofluorescens]
MRNRLHPYRTTLARYARQVVPAVVSGATAGITGWLLTFLVHHL